MRIIYDNLVDDATITSSTEMTTYPDTNLQHIHTSRVWRTTSGSVSTQWILLDAGAGNTFTVDSISILAHNFTNAATLAFQMNATDAWGGPSVNEVLTWRDGIIMKYFTGGSYRYARFAFTDAANPDNYLEIGRLVMGEYLQITPSSKKDFTILNQRTDAVAFAVSGEPYSDIGYMQRIFRYEFPPSDYALIASLRTVYDTVGKYKPFIFCNFDARYTEIEPAYVVFVNDLEEIHKGYNKMEYSLELREVT